MMWFFKGFVGGIGILIGVLLGFAVIMAVVTAPMLIGREIFGDAGLPIGLAFELVVLAGFGGAWQAYEDKQKEDKQKE